MPGSLMRAGSYQAEKSSARFLLPSALQRLWEKTASKPAPRKARPISVVHATTRSPLQPVTRLIHLGTHAADGAVVAGSRVEELINLGNRNALRGAHAEELHGFRADKREAQREKAEFAVLSQSEGASRIELTDNSEGIDGHSHVLRLGGTTERGTPGTEIGIFEQELSGKFRSGTREVVIARGVVEQRAQRRRNRLGDQGGGLSRRGQTRRKRDGREQRFDELARWDFHVSRAQGKELRAGGAGGDEAGWEIDHGGGGIAVAQVRDELLGGFALPLDLDACRWSPGFFRSESGGSKRSEANREKKRDGEAGHHRNKVTVR